MTEQLIIRTDGQVGARPAASAASVIARVRSLLPVGGALPDAVWRTRHRVILALLWLHVPIFAAYVLISGHEVVSGLAEVAAIAVLAFLATLSNRSRRFREVAASLGLVTCSGVLVHLSGGFIEMHFHFFVVVALMSLYQDWPPFLVAIGYVLVHHGLMGTLAPSAVYNHAPAWDHPWRWAAIHAAFVVAASGASIAAWHFSETEQGRRLAEQERAARWQAAQLAVTRVLAEAESLQAAMTQLLPTLCGTFGWEWAAVWEMSEETGQLQRSVTWQTPATDFRAFDEASRDHRFAPGEGLIGSVWSSREPLWVVDVAADPRNRRLVAAASGRPRGAVFIPLVAADRVLGVIELISQELRLPDPKLLDMLSGLGSQFGQFVQRRREQERLQTELESERVRLEAVLQQLPVGVIIAEAPSGKMVLGNPLSETITGQPAAAASIEEYGRYHGFHLDGSPYEPRDHPLARSLTTGEIVSGEIFELERGEDDTVIVEFSSAPIRDGQDQITAGVVVIQDVTERERAQAENRRLQDELETELRRAAEIQAQLLPQAAPTVAGYAFAGVCLPARHTGGDYFDWGATDGGVQVALGDVMGKGMSAALLTATVRAALRAVSNLPVAEAVAAVNRTLFPDLAASASFATLFHAHVDAASGVLSYVDAGHGMAFIYRRDGGVEPLSQRGLALGLLADARYQEGHTVLEPGETLVIYSDGLPDARPDLSLDHGGVAAQLNGAVNVEEQLERLVAPATAGGSLPDDLTIIIVHRLNGSSSGEYGNEENDKLLAAVGHDGPGTIPLRSSVAHAPARLKTA